MNWKPLPRLLMPRPRPIPVGHSRAQWPVRPHLKHSLLLMAADYRASPLACLSAPGRAVRGASAAETRWLRWGVGAGCSQGAAGRSGSCRALRHLPALRAVTHHPGSSGFSLRLPLPRVGRSAASRGRGRRAARCAAAGGSRGGRRRETACRSRLLSASLSPPAPQPGFRSRGGQDPRDGSWCGFAALGEAARPHAKSNGMARPATG